MKSNARPRVAAYAVVRIDAFQDESVEWQNRITVTKVLMDQKLAETEVLRLGQLNANRGVIYFWQSTHLEQHQEEG